MSRNQPLVNLQIREALTRSRWADPRPNSLRFYVSSAILSGGSGPTTFSVSTLTVMTLPIYYDHHPPHTFVIPSEARNLLVPARTEPQIPHWLNPARNDNSSGPRRPP
jgi:hypothetical protein